VGQGRKGQQRRQFHVVDPECVLLAGGQQQAVEGLAGTGSLQLQARCVQAPASGDQAPDDVAGQAGQLLARTPAAFQRRAGQVQATQLEAGGGQYHAAATQLG